MGMYDQVTISKEFKLPFTDEQQASLDNHLGGKRTWNRVFQTKDLSCWLDYYLIDPGGKLFELFPDGENKFFDLTGEITLGECISSDCMDTDLWFDLKIKLNKGIVVNTQVVEWMEHDNKNRKTFRAQMDHAREQARERQRRLSWKCYNVLWAIPVDWSLSHVGRLGRWLDKMSMHARRVLLFWN